MTGLEPGLIAALAAGTAGTAVVANNAGKQLKNALTPKPLASVEQPKAIEPTKELAAPKLADASGAAENLLLDTKRQQGRSGTRASSLLNVGDDSLIKAKTTLGA